MPVYTVGFGAEQVAQDVEIEDVVVASRVLAGSRLSATVKFQQRGYGGRKSTLTVRDGGRADVQGGHLGPGRQRPRKTCFLTLAPPAPRPCSSWRASCQEANRANNTLTRLVNVDPDPRRILYFEGEPRWEYKYIGVPRKTTA